MNDLKLPKILADHMVVQRDVPVHLWGWDQPGQTVVATLERETAQATAAADGSWSVRLPVPPAGGPYGITIQGSSTRVLHDVLVGDVWICSGQSNMEWPLCNTQDGAAAVAAATHPRLRLFQVPRLGLTKPQADLGGDAWTPCTPETVREFSAVGYYFGRELERELDIPIGLVNSSVGGTSAEAWTSQEALSAHPRLAGLGLAPDTVRDNAFRDAMAPFVRLAGGQPVITDVPLNPDGTLPDAGRRNFTKDWESPAFADAAWPEMELPAFWQTRGLLLNGAVWFRRTIELPADWAGQELTLELGVADDFDVTWFNGVQVGATGKETPEWWMHPRQYAVPGRLVKAGRNVIAVRVFDHLNAGGLRGPAEAMRLRPCQAPETVAVPLTGRWRHAVEQAHPCVEINPGTVLYNAMIHPLVRFPAKGAIWYQGENNAARAEEYRELLPVLIADWRARWAAAGAPPAHVPGTPPFAFHIVQLAAWQPPMEDGAQGWWPALREAQRDIAATVPGCGLAVTVDIGDAMDIHPKNKLDVGRRLALQALAKTYGRSVACDGPVCVSVTAEGARLRLAFTTDGGALCCRDGGTLCGFALAGADRVFHEANAVIDGKTVVLSSPHVAAPVAVRYAWADNPPNTLADRNGLPAGPFQAQLSA
jgi:sialate O-acetylesterase